MNTDERKPYVKAMAKTLEALPLEDQLTIAVMLPLYVAAAHDVDPLYTLRSIEASWIAASGLEVEGPDAAITSMTDRILAVLRDTTAGNVGADGRMAAAITALAGYAIAAKLDPDEILSSLREGFGSVSYAEGTQAGLGVRADARRGEPRAREGVSPRARWAARRHRRAPIPPPRHRHHPPRA